MRRHYVFTFMDDTGAVRYIGVGRETRGAKPWEELWDSRFRCDSPVAHWLRGYIEPPVRGNVGSGEAMSEVAAGELFTINRRRLLESGANLLSTRPLGSYVTGGGLCNPVVCGDEGLWFASIREAARHYGVNASTIQRRVNRGTDGWRRA